jgi:uncharacterized membrane protein
MDKFIFLEISNIEYYGEKTLVYFSIILIVAILFSFKSFNSTTFLPSGIDTPAHIFKIKFVKDVFLKFETIPAWDNNWYGGYPIFSLYPALPYVIPTSSKRRY